MVNGVIMDAVPDDAMGEEDAELPAGDGVRSTLVATEIPPIESMGTTTSEGGESSLLKNDERMDIDGSPIIPDAPVADQNVEANPGILDALVTSKKAEADPTTPGVSEIPAADNTLLPPMANITLIERTDGDES